jgi:hypothetical protein
MRSVPVTCLSTRSRFSRRQCRDGETSSPVQVRVRHVQANSWSAAPDAWGSTRPNWSHWSVCPAQMNFQSNHATCCARDVGPHLARYVFMSILCFLCTCCHGILSKSSPHSPQGILRTASGGGGGEAGTDAMSCSFLTAHSLLCDFCRCWSTPRRLP